MSEMSGDDLDRLQTHATAALRAVQAAKMRSRQGKHADAEEYLTQATESARSVVGGLQARGAMSHDSVATALAEPLSLAQMDTPALRGLAAALRAALPFAEAVDAERGRALDTVVGGSAGLDFAEDLAQFIARVEIELHGPTGSGLE